MKTKEFIYKIIFVFALHISTFSYAMDKSFSNVCIIDQNTGLNLNEFFPQEHSIIGIFGATPRYSFFVRFQETLTNHFNQIIQLQKKSKALKGINKDLKPIIQTLVNQKRITCLTQLIEQLKIEDQFYMFFKMGLNQKLLQDNITTLLEIVSSLYKNAKPYVKECSISNNSIYLIHMLMLCYFNDIGIYLKEEKININKLHIFLKTIALFYKEIYEKICSEKK